jgi:hypothetical protein
MITTPSERSLIRVTADGGKHPVTNGRQRPDSDSRGFPRRFAASARSDWLGHKPSGKKRQDSDYFVRGSSAALT